MDGLHRSLTRLARTDNFGGRIIQTDEKTLVLYDCGLWTDSHTQYMHSKFPEVSICISSSQSSLSGFIIVFQMQQKTFLKYTSILVCMLVMLILTVRHFLGIE